MLDDPQSAGQRERALGPRQRAGEGSERRAVVTADQQQVLPPAALGLGVKAKLVTSTVSLGLGGVEGRV